MPVSTAATRNSSRGNHTTVSILGDNCRLLGLKAVHSSVNVCAPKSETVLTTDTLATAAKQRAVSPQGAQVRPLKRLPIPPQPASSSHQQKGKLPQRPVYMSCDKAHTRNKLNGGLVSCSLWSLYSNVKTAEN